MRACSRRSREAISRRVGRSAVAVSAIRGTSGQRSWSTASSRYSGRKSWPHCETQCASSIANRASGIWPEPGEETVAQEPLGSEVEQVQFARGGLPANPALLLGREARVQECRAQTELAQRHHLILHERDQRADDDRRAGAEQGRDLVAQRLAAARWHDHERVAARHHTAHDLFLLTSEGAEAEDVVQDRSRIRRPVRGVERTSHGRTHAVLAAIEGGGLRNQRLSRAYHSAPQLGTRCAAHPTRPD